MLAQDLIGTWKQKGGGSVLHLLPDLSAICEGHLKSGAVTIEKAKWLYVDATHWNLYFLQDPSADVEPLEIIEYSVVSFTPTRMEIAAEHFDLPVVYVRAPSGVSDKVIEI